MGRNENNSSKESVKLASSTNIYSIIVFFWAVGVVWWPFKGHFNSTIIEIIELFLTSCLCLFIFSWFMGYCRFSNDYLTISFGLFTLFPKSQKKIDYSHVHLIEYYSSSFPQGKPFITIHIKQKRNFYLLKMFRQFDCKREDWDAIIWAIKNKSVRYVEKEHSEDIITDEKVLNYMKNYIPRSAKDKQC